MLLVLFFLACMPWQYKTGQPANPWCALHLLNFTSDSSLIRLETQLPELAAAGITMLILEVDYGFAFISHPELRGSDDPISRAGAKRLVKACRKNGIMLVPQFQCFGHQSWAGTTFVLLTRYPEFDLTPGAYPDNKGIYCREWDPLNPAVHAMVFDLLDELIEAFDAEMLHVGMDEVFLIGDSLSPSTFGKNPASVFAGVVNDLYGHIVKKRQKRMMMWGDRLIDSEKYDLGEWEASKNGTAAAIDSIPKDIIICDWHYELRENYPSLPLFLEKGFEVLPTSWRKPEAVQAFIRYSQSLNDPDMLGHLFTMWSGKKDSLAWFPPLAQFGKRVRLGSATAHP
jgi:hypothetical protein